MKIIKRIRSCFVSMLIVFLVVPCMDPGAGLPAFVKYAAAAEPDSSGQESSSPGAGGVVKTDNPDAFLDAFGSDHADVLAETIDGRAVTTVTLNSDVVLAQPLTIVQGQADDKVVIDLVGHVIFGAAGVEGGDYDSACGQNAIEIAAAGFDVEIRGPGAIIGGDGAVFESENHFRVGADGGMGICLCGISNEPYFDTLNYGITVTDGAVIRGGNGADITGEDWQYNFAEYTGIRGIDAPAFAAGYGGTAIGQTAAGIVENDSAEENPAFYSAYYKIVVENGTVKGGDGGAVSMDGITPTVYAVMNDPTTGILMQGKQPGDFVDQVGWMMGAAVGAGGNGIDIGRGRKYVLVDDAGVVQGGDAGGADFGSGRTINRLSKSTRNAGDGIAVFGDIGLTEDSVDFTAWESKDETSSDMGIFIRGTVLGGNSPDAYALNESTCDAGAGISLHGETKYGNASHWGIIEVDGHVAGGSAGKAVSGNGGAGGAGIYEAYNKGEEPTDNSRFGTDYFVINGTVSGGNGGTAYSNAATTEDTSYSTMVYVPALSGAGGFGRGGNGILFGNYRKNLNITGSGVVRAGNAGNTVDREGADVNNSAAEAIPFFSNPAEYNNTVTVVTENGSGAVAESKTTINVQASMDSFTENPSTDTELHCEAELPAGYTGDVYITWEARLYPTIGTTGSEYKGFPFDLESAGTDYSSFSLLDNAAYQYLAYPMYAEHPELNMNHYNYDIATASRMSESDVRGNKIQICCYLMLEDGSWGKSNVIEFTGGQGWTDTNTSTLSAEEREAAEAVAGRIEMLSEPEGIGLYDAAVVEEIRAAYDSLTDAQKELISPELLQKLTAAEAKIAELKGEDPGDNPAGQNPNPGNPGPGGNAPGQNPAGSAVGQNAGNTGVTGSGATGVNAQKKPNPMQLKGRTAKVKYKKLKKKAQTLAVSKVITFTENPEGAVSYKLSSAKKGRKSFKKYFKINASTGKLKIKKGLKKGTYKVKVKVTAAGNANYEASGTKTVTFKVKVK